MSLEFPYGLMFDIVLLLKPKNSQYGEISGIPTMTETGEGQRYTLAVPVSVSTGWLDDPNHENGAYFKV